jgi:hypothetical protein
MRTSGGKWGKLGGFDYYLRSENKLRPNQRRDFLVRSEDYIFRINQLSLKQYPYMDEQMSDRELVDMWNEIWSMWGWVIDEFKDKWLREKLSIEKKQKEINQNNSNDWWN